MHRVKDGNKNLRVNKRVCALGRLISMAWKGSDCVSEGRRLGMHRFCGPGLLRELRWFVLGEGGVNTIKMLELYKGQGRSC